MVSARRTFLHKGYYDVLATALCDTVKKYIRNGDVLLDAGCGEGYYTAKVAGALAGGAEIIGLDISKFAVEAAAKAKCWAALAVASIFHMPIAENSCDMLMSLFAPYCAEEFTRVLKPRGIMLMVIPAERHLWQLKQAIYDTPYLNEVQDYALEGFSFLEAVKIADTITIDNNEDIMSLFSMTPYYYRTDLNGMQRARALTSLTTEIAFEILVYSEVDSRE